VAACADRTALAAAVVVTAAAVAGDVALSPWSLVPAFAFLPRGFLGRWLTVGTAPLRVLRGASVGAVSSIGGKWEWRGWSNRINKSPT
jgi:hypothetical protein